MSQNVLLEITFVCADHAALLRSSIQQGLVSGTIPDRVAVHGTALTPVPADWVTVDFRDKMLKSDWDDGSYVLAIGPDLVRISTRNFALDVGALVTSLTGVEFETANVRHIRWWDNPRGPAYKAPASTMGTSPLGFAVALRGNGHRRAISRRWLDRGPWRVLRGAHDTSLLQFHDETADVLTSLEQARPCHARLADPDQAPLPIRDSYRAGQVPLQGTYVAPDRQLVVSVAGRTVSRREMYEAVAARFYQLLGPDKPLDNVVFSFMDPAELDQALPDLWLYGLEARLRDGNGWHRVDDQYTPPPYDKPDWVKRLGRDDKVGT